MLNGRNTHHSLLSKSFSKKPIQILFFSPIKCPLQRSNSLILNRSLYFLLLRELSTSQRERHQLPSNGFQLLFLLVLILMNFPSFTNSASQSMAVFLKLPFPTASSPHHAQITRSLSTQCYSHKGFPYPYNQSLFKVSQLWCSF